MDFASLKKEYLEFFKSKGHAVIPGASLVPEHDPTVLFTTAGMHPLVPYLLGQKHPAGNRLVDVQKCIRTGDIEEVGDSWHLTFFEMLGNWSLGDYWKEEAIEWSWEFLTSPKWLGLDKKRLAVSVFAGDNDASFDKEAFDIWRDLGMSEARIAKLSKNDNWWGPAGQTGPCGPDTEMFYWIGDPDEVPDIFDAKDPLWVEIWNDVFMQYSKTAEGKYESLKQRNVDTGMGVERTVAAINGYDNVYETDVFKPILKVIEILTKTSESTDSFERLYNPGQITAKEIAELRIKAERTRAYRIIADHIKAATFILAEGVEPSNVERGYVLRRLIRRAVRYGKQLGINEVFTFKIAQMVVEIYKDIYPELWRGKDFIINQLVREEEKFGKTLEIGLQKFNKYVLSRKPIDKFGRIGKAWDQKDLPGDAAFDLYQTYGFPKEVIQELCKENEIYFDEEGFDRAFKKHQELSRAGAEQKFKGGLADQSEQVVKYHTAAHLMLAALRRVLGEGVFQKGSNITAERLRFDFSYSEKMTPEQIKQVEDLVNEKIKEDLSVKMEEMSLEEAKKQGAMGVFESKYGQLVKVYTIGPSTDSAGSPQAGSGQAFSKEICGGPHIERIGVLGKFKIVKEESSSAGVRRIKAVLE